MPLIRLRGVTKVYGEGALAFAALKGVDLDIARGDFVAIMGPSGSGKSTAMNTLGCLDRPTTGDYLFQGVHVESLTRDERARLRRRFFGFVFQGFNLLARTTAQENVELPLLYRGESAAVRRQAAAQALDAVGLKGWEHHTPAELSGGQQQRVAIARAIVTNPAVLLADEPTGNLDTPSGGTYRFRGVHVERLDRDQRALLRRLYLGFVFQGYNLLARTSAQENVELPLVYRGEHAGARREAAREALAQVGLDGWGHHTPAELSGGQQQRVAIARAIVTRPQVLLADEPTGNLDTNTSREIMDLIASLNRERGITVLMVTHEPDMAAYARRVVRFVDGRVESDRRSGDPGEPR